MCFCALEACFCMFCTYTYTHVCAYMGVSEICAYVYMLVCACVFDSKMCICIYKSANIFGLIEKCAYMCVLHIVCASKPDVRMCMCVFERICK